MRLEGDMNLSCFHFILLLAKQLMVFSSHIFLFLFLPLVLVINRFLTLKASNLFLLIASLVFYALGEGLLVILLLCSISWNYFFGRLIGHKGANKVFLAIAITGNLLLLAYYKYFGFIVESSFLKNLISESHYSNIILPIGISFFTFQGISYLVDVYRGTNKAESDPIKLGLYISFFPQLVAGPIVKYNELASYLSERKTTLDQTTIGAFKFLRGLTKKVIIADTLALVADQIFLLPSETIPGPLAWLGVLIYSLQIYYDFSGYSDMAIGMCLILGFSIPENFNYPYLSKSVREFWRRWHISLSTWFRDYLYIPLGGNRKGMARLYFNLLIVFFLTGLWHGASYNFIIWGMIHGIFMIAERTFPLETRKLPSLFKHVYLLLVVCLSWVFFRIESFSEAVQFLQRMFSFSMEGDWYPGIFLNAYFYFILFVAILFAFPLRQKIALFFKTKIVAQKHLLLGLNCGLYLALAFLCWMELSMSSYSPFIYYKF